jgi:hypothetical protein
MGRISRLKSTVLADGSAGATEAPGVALMIHVNAIESSKPNSNRGFNVESLRPPTAVE